MVQEMLKLLARGPKGSLDCCNVEDVDHLLLTCTSA
jgi:hypothetical protein